MYNFFKYLLFRPVVRFLFRGTVEGAENIPQTGGALLASNHIAAGETFITPALIRRPVTFPAKAELFKGNRGLGSKILAWFMKSIKQVPLDRAGGRVSLEGLGPVLQVLDEGGLVGIYPEGTRSPDGRLYKGHTGVARMALAAGVPVIPVAAFNTGTIKGLFGIPWINRPRVVIGKPLDFSAYAGQHDDRATLRWVTDEVMASIQELSGQTYVEAYASSVKRGSLSAAEADARVQERPGLGATPPPLPSGKLS
ncbi:MAG: 1-acyl-sn-glycerol-3-phosphate acyltransferase [Actinobacteria bacterium HGW-Actinobacteria-2]|nr:MAG: 1-acyl-sn-glycerol-3-phosphate acyltransferase [Actinobacteria bacterium HGW-Actinobacteria-2]